MSEQGIMLSTKTIIANMAANSRIGGKDIGFANIKFVCSNNCTSSPLTHVNLHKNYEFWFSYY